MIFSRMDIHTGARPASSAICSNAFFMAVVDDGLVLELLFVVDCRVTSAQVRVGVGFCC